LQEPGPLDPLTKELIYAAVSVTNQVLDPSPDKARRLIYPLLFHHPVRSPIAQPPLRESCCLLDSHCGLATKQFILRADQRL